MGPIQAGAGSHCGISVSAGLQGPFSGASLPRRSVPPGVLHALKDRSRPLFERHGDSLLLSSRSVIASRSLLSWWQQYGRCDRNQKPWMFRADGRWPAAEEALNPYPIWIAEVMHLSAASHSRPTFYELCSLFGHRWCGCSPVQKSVARPLSQNPQR